MEYSKAMAVTSKKSIILHVDMDHFFSAVEERENPRYKGQPVVVGADPNEGKGRGVVQTCNYEARKFGIHLGMPISRAWRRCPHAIYVRGNYRLYRETSADIMRILRTHSEKFEQWGLDEAFLDISVRVQNWEEATNLAKTIKHEICEKVKLTCSIGVAPNKLVAKIASDFKKPDGITAVAEDAVETFLAPLSVRKLLGVGKQTERKLNEMGIQTIRDLGAFDVSKLIERFGVMGKRFHQFAHGIYDSEVGKPRGMIKSMGHERTFNTDTEDHDTILKRLDALCQRIHKRIVQHQILFRTVTVKIRDENFQTHTHRKSWRTYTNRLDELLKAVRSLAKKQLHRKAKIRLVGVRVSNLTTCKGQRTLI